MKLFAIIILLWFSESKSLSQKDQDSSKSNVFSPRMDYDEWTPLGRGDPLKNDPTYDYVPPVLERVHYWMEPSKRTPDPPVPNSGLLVLGSRTETVFATRPTTPRYHLKEPQADSRIDASSLLDPFFKLVDASQFNLNFNSNNHYKTAPNRIQRPHYQTSKHRTQPPQALQRPPYTMLMPPPPPPTNFVTSQATTAANKATSQQVTVALPSTPSLPQTTKNSTMTTTTINPTVLANTANVFKPVAISMPEAMGHLTQKPRPKNPSTEKTTTTTTEKAVPVLPIVALFDGNKKQTMENIKPKYPEKQQQLNPNHLHPPTTAKQKPPKNSEAYERINKVKEAVTRTKTSDVVRYTKASGGSDGALRATTAPPTTTTKAAILHTTDPMFKHYKQPSEPVGGPFYLIIQGHSKVKTYGASKNPINKLLTSNEIKSVEESGKKKNLERKGRRLGYDVPVRANGNELEEEDGGEEEEEEARTLAFTGQGSLESLEETFPKSDGGSSKKRYLESTRRRKRFARRRLLTEEDSGNPTDNLDLESLIAVSDDYDPEDVANVLLRQEASQGSGFGNLASSVLSGPGRDV